MEDCKCRKKVRSEENKKRLNNRINRIEGQIRGIKRMIEEDAYCPDVILQISAVCSALSSLSRTMLTDHVNTCVLSDIASGKSEAADELSALLERIIK